MPNSTLQTAPRILLDNARKFQGKARFQIPDGTGGWNPILWDDYMAHIEHTALWLMQNGIGPDQKCAVFAGTRVEWTYAGLAIQCARGVLVPIYHSSTPEQAHYVLEHSDARILFTESCYMSHVNQILDRLPLLEKIVVLDASTESRALNGFKPSQELKNRLVLYRNVLSEGAILAATSPQKLENHIAQTQDHEAACIIYTSGTTGMPKGVVLSHFNVVRNGEDWVNVLGSLIPEEKVDLLWLPLSHIFGWGEIGLGNSLGFETYFTNPKDVLSLMPKLKPTVFMSVPAYWEKLYLTAKNVSGELKEQIQKLHEITGGRLKFCLSGGAGLKREVKDFYKEAGILLIEGYGLTEASPTITMNQPDSYNFDTVGKPFPSVKVRLAEDGEIECQGPNVFVGYYKNEQATRDTMTEDGWLKTGDLGEFTPDGFLKIIGRKKDIIVTAGGKNISPQLIEAHFLDDQLIENIVLYGNERKYLVAMITLKQTQATKWAENAGIFFKNFTELCQTEALRSAVQSSVDSINSGLASYETIKKFFIHPESLSLEAGHLTPSLKIKRNVIHKEFEASFSSLY